MWTCLENHYYFTAASLLCGFEFWVCLLVTPFCHKQQVHLSFCHTLLGIFIHMCACYIPCLDILKLYPSSHSRLFLSLEWFSHASFCHGAQHHFHQRGSQVDQHRSQQSTPGRQSPATRRSSSCGFLSRVQSTDWARQFVLPILVANQGVVAK